MTNELETKVENDVCSDCGEPAEYIRKTQFAGDHLYCEIHALEQEDFMQDGGSYFYWIKIGDKK